MRRRLLAALTAVLLVATGCGSGANGDSPDGLRLVTAFYPLEFLSRWLGGPEARITTLTKAGAEPHDVELNPRQVASISDAQLVVYLGGFQPAVDQAVGQEAKDRAYDAGSVVELLPAAVEHDHGHDEEPGAEEHADEATGGKDPHVWLDPLRFATISDKLAERLVAIDPGRATAYRERAADLRLELENLDKAYTTGLKTCQRRELVTSHTAFAYLASRYDLHEVGITGISPEAEASPQRLAAVAREAKETGATTIFFETLVSPKVAETIAREVGAKTAVLDPIEGRTDPEADYLSLMRANLTALTQALGCTS